MIGLVTVLGSLRRLSGAIMALIIRFPLHFALIAALGANLWQWRGWTREQSGRAADRVAYAAAQVQAKARQASADRANLEAQSELEHAMETAHAQTETARELALRDYLARHRLRTETACRSSGRAGQAGLHPDPTEPAGAAPTGDLAAIAPADLDRLTQGYLRGAECTGYLRALIDGGWAREGEDANPAPM